MSESGSPTVDVSAILNSEEAPQVEGPPVEEPAPAPAEESVEEPSAPAAPAAPAAPEEAVESEGEVPSTQEVVQNVQEMLSSTDTSGSVNELENRVKVLEERFEKAIRVLSRHHGRLNGI